MEKEIHTIAKRTRSKIDLGNYLKNRHITREKLAEQLGISHTMVTSACRGRQIQLNKADRIAIALGEKTEDIFILEDNFAPLSSKTVKEYHQQKLRLLNDDRWQNLDFVFTQDDGQPMNPGSITSWLSDFSKRHGLPHINPHTIRHMVASVLIANGLDIVMVSKQLGHTKVSTTDDYYAHIIEDEKSKASECIAEVMLRRKKA